MFTGVQRCKQCVPRDNIPPVLGQRPKKCLLILYQIICKTWAYWYYKTPSWCVILSSYIFTERWNWLINGEGPFHLQLPETLIISSARMSLYMSPPSLSHSPSLLPLTSTMLPAKTRQLYAGVIPKKLHSDLPSFSKHFFHNSPPLLFLSLTPFTVCLHMNSIACCNIVFF